MFCLAVVRRIRSIFLESTGSFECQFEGVGCLRKIMRQQRGFGDKNVLPGSKMIYPSEKMGSEEAFGAGAFDRIADFFPGDKPYTLERVFAAEEEDKIRGMPCLGSTPINRIKLTGVSQAVEVF